jgi:hypothetical protein
MLLCAAGDIHGAVERLHEDWFTPLCLHVIGGRNAMRGQAGVLHLAFSV